MESVGISIDQARKRIRLLKDSEKEREELDFRSRTVFQDALTKDSAREQYLTAFFEKKPANISYEDIVAMATQQIEHRHPYLGQKQTHLLEELEDAKEKVGESFDPSQFLAATHSPHRSLDLASSACARACAEESMALDNLNRVNSTISDLLVDCGERFSEWVESAGKALDESDWDRGGGTSIFNVHTSAYKRLPRACQLFLTEDDYWTRAYDRNHWAWCQKNRMQDIFGSSDSSDSSDSEYYGEFSPVSSPS